MCVCVKRSCSITFLFFTMTRNRSPLLDSGDIECSVCNIDLYVCVCVCVLYFFTFLILPYISFPSFSHCCISLHESVYFWSFHLSVLLSPAVFLRIMTASQTINNNNNNNNKKSALKFSTSDRRIEESL